MHMTLMDVLHMMIIVSVLSVAVWPLEVVKKGAFLAPALISLGWVLFSGCILMPYDVKENKRREFLYPILKQFAPRLTFDEYTNWIIFTLTSVPTFILYRTICADRQKKNI